MYGICAWQLDPCCYQLAGKEYKRPLFPKQLNDLLNMRGCKNKRVKLIACNTGMNGPKGEKSFAELLSRQKYRNGVTAPNRSVWFTRYGINPTPYGHKGEPKDDQQNPNDPGKYVTF